MVLIVIAGATSRTYEPQEDLAAWPCQVQLSFMAEIDHTKQKYLASRFPGTPIFADVSDMKRRHARCHDGQSAEVPEAKGQTNN